MRRSRLLRALRVVGVVLLVLVLLAVYGVVWTIRRPFPDVAGEQELPGLQGTVEVVRDGHGVPWVTGGDPLDLYRAQGWVHAQDRFWQMDTWRAISGGRLAERFGADQLPTDRFLRSLRWHDVAAAEYELLDPAHRAVLDAYAEGVNAHLDQRAEAALGLEFAVLSLINRDYQPEPWTPVDSLAFLKVLAWDLRSNLDTEIERAVLEAHLGPDVAAALFPPYPDDAPVIVEEFTPPADALAGLEPPARQAVAPLLAEVGTRVAAVDDAIGRVGGEGLGSNSWVVAGRHTASGLPLLANDPHLGVQMPSIWYQMGLRCAPVDDGCPLEVAGFSIAGVPGIVIGHNARIAWGLTNLAPDVMDLYVEQVHPDDPGRYLADGEWVDFEVTEVVLEGGPEPEVLRVRATRHGPVVSDTYAPLDDVDPAAAVADAADAEAPGPYVIALAWTALEPGTTFAALTDVNAAADFDDFVAAAEQFDVPAQNLVYADVDGHIGYVAPGRIPIRAAGDGLRPVPGWTSAHDWVGEVPRDALPRLLDPDRGWIVTANHAVADPEGAGRLLTHEWSALGYRAARIEELLAEADRPLTAEDLAAMQLDAADLSARWLVPALLEVDPDDEAGRTAQGLLADWDQQLAADSAGAAVHSAVGRQLLLRAFADDLPDEHPLRGGSRWFEVVRLLLDEPDHPLWDDRSTSRRETAPDILAAALSAGVDELTERLGEDVSGWRWGDLHTAEFRSATLGESGIGLVEDRFNRGPFPTGGGTSVVNATAWDAREGYEVVAAPSMRMVVDLADFDASLAIHTTGQSGHPYHPNHIDLAPLWAAGEHLPFAWSPDAVRAAAAHELTLLPAEG